MRPPSIKISVEGGNWPPEEALRRLAERAVKAAIDAIASKGAAFLLPQRGREGPKFELGILFADDAAIRTLNAKWRGKDKPTNVLSFPQAPGPRRLPSSEEAGGPALLGDIVLAAETVAREAALADKPLEDHMAHLIIHGFLHLLGYDHEVEAQAEEMEELERAALSRMGLADPYAAARRQ
jgi:probable rRNA maturation factor